MPDLIGLSVSEADMKMREIGLYYEYYGEGESGDKVVYQVPAAGSVINKKSVAYIAVE